ncbi:MAG: hypothetical protein O7H41_21365 [Planctomycetota bacterium]|nr:hypothetical protein [Planctomycetota bacterium]
MAVFELLIGTPLIWRVWYACLGPAYFTLIFFPNSRFSQLLFDRGYVLLLPVVHVFGLTIGGTIANVWFGFPFFMHLASTTGEFGHIQIAAAFGITASTADLVFASVILRKYDDLNVVWKLVVAFWVLAVGWLLGLLLYLLLRYFKGPRDQPVRIGVMEIG